jgi:type IV secretion system pilin
MIVRLQRIGSGMLSLVFAAAPSLAFALDPVECPQGTACGPLPQIILNLINYVLAIVGVIALAYLVYGGFRYITSAGNEETIEEAKRIIFNAIIGIVVIGVAAALVNFVIQGVNVAGGL